MKHVVVGFDNANEVVSKELESGVNELVVWKIGDRDRPATGEDIADFIKHLEAGLKNPESDITHFVTHHAVNVVRVQFQPGCCPNGCCQSLPLESSEDLLGRMNAELDELQAIDDDFEDDIVDDAPQNPQ